MHRSGTGLFLWVVAIVLLLLISVKISMIVLLVWIFFISSRIPLIFSNVCNALMLAL